MNPRTLGCHLLAGAFISFALGLAVFGPAPAYAVVTTTIIGWNVPSGTTFSNGIGALLIPLAGVALFSGIPIAFGQRGDFVVTMSLVGLLIGSVLGTLSINNSTPTAIPFALIVLAGFCLMLWMWRGRS